MPEKDPSNTALFVEWMRQFTPYFTTVFLSIWGGVVNHLRNSLDKKQQEIKTLENEIIQLHAKITQLENQKGLSRETMDDLLGDL